MLSRSTPEYAVRRMVSAISSAMDSSVLVIAPFGWGEVPVQSATRESPRLRKVTKSRIGLP